jgi:hypothetical protein
VIYDSILLIIIKEIITTMANPNLIRQIEYYLSEENLQGDEYFYKEVSANK